MSYTTRLRKAIRTAATLETYLQNIRDSATRQPRFGSRGPRGSKVQIGLLPFSFDLPATTVVLASATQVSWDMLSAAIGTMADDTIPGATNKQKVAGFSPARVVYFYSPSRQVTTPVSQRTGLEYQKYAGRTYTAPFGRGGADGNDEFDNFMQIRGELLPANYEGVRRVSRQIERRKQVS